MSDAAKRLLVIVINDRERLDEILTGFVELGVTGATIINTEGMGRILSDVIPVFAGLQAAAGTARPENVTILSIVAEDRVDAVLALVKHVCGDLDAPSTGIAFVLPVMRVVGLAPRLVTRDSDQVESLP
jgi:nitrogen regulatory protein PII